MNPAIPAAELEALHPSLWRASQLARNHARTVDTGHAALNVQLPGKGWPVGTLVDLLVQQPGIGEMRLIAPALASVARAKIVLLQPPHAPQTLALASLGLSPESVLWLRSERTADALWAAEQVLKSGSCGALLFWPGLTSANSARQQPVRVDSLRRLHLAAQQGETLFFNFRPLNAEHDPSPAPLRLSLRPALGGINVGFVKRQGPQRDAPLFLPMPVTITHVQTQPEAVPVRAKPTQEVVFSGVIRKAQTSNGVKETSTHIAPNFVP